MAVVKTSTGAWASRTNIMQNPRSIHSPDFIQGDLEETSKSSLKSPRKGKENAA